MSVQQIKVNIRYNERTGHFIRGRGGVEDNLNWVVLSD